MIKNRKKYQKKYIKALCNIFFNELATLTCDVACSKLKRDGENMVVLFCQTNILYNFAMKRN